MKKVIAIIISILIIFGIMIIGLVSIIDKEHKISGDSLKFKEEYELLNGKYYDKENRTAISLAIDKDNPFIYVNDNNILDKLENGTHIIYIGYPECGWSRRVIPVLSTFAKKNKIDKIYYYNFYNLKKELEKNKNKEKKDLYEKILEITNSNNEFEIPCVIFLKDGKLIGKHSKILESYTDYNIDLSKEQSEKLLNIYQNNFNKMFVNICEEEC